MILLDNIPIPIPHNNLIINGGSITVSQSYEGLEGQKVTVTGGNIEITASDDGINAASSSSSGLRSSRRPSPRRMNAARTSPLFRARPRSSTARSCCPRQSLPLRRPIPKAASRSAEAFHFPKISPCTATSLRPFSISSVSTKRTPSDTRSTARFSARAIRRFPPLRHYSLIRQPFSSKRRHAPHPLRHSKETANSSMAL